MGRVPVSLASAPFYANLRSPPIDFDDVKTTTKERKHEDALLPTELDDGRLCLCFSLLTHRQFRQARNGYQEEEEEVEEEET